jgi:hypothetical protein
MRRGLVLLALISCGPARPIATPGPAQQPLAIPHPGTPFAARCNITGREAAVDLARASEAVRKLTRIGPPTNDFRFTADSKNVIYGGGSIQVPATGGAARKVSGAPDDRISDAPFQAFLKAQGHLPETVLPLTTTLAVTMEGAPAEVTTLAAIDLAAHTLEQITPDKLYLIWNPQRVDDHSVAFIARDRRMYIADLQTRELRCASIEVPGQDPISSLFATTADGHHLLYAALAAGTWADQARTYALHLVDLNADTDTTVATVNDAYTIVPVAAGQRAIFIVQVDYHARGTMAFYALDANTGAITRVTRELRGWSNIAVAPDGSRVASSQGEVGGRDARPPKPPALARQPGQNDTCDPMNACDGSACGWQSNGCYDYEWCGACPGQQAPPEAVNPDDGLFTFPL